MGIMRFGYEKSSQSIGLTMENMRFEYEKCSNTIGFALEIMRYCMRNHPNPLDLQWRTWDLSMLNAMWRKDLRCEGTWMWRSKTQDVTSSFNRHGNCYTRKPTYAETQKHSPLPQTQFTHSNVPNPHARKTSAPNPHARKAATRNSRSSYWRSRPETNFKHNTRGTKHNKTLEKKHKTPVKPWPNTCHARAKRNNKT